MRLVMWPHLTRIGSGNQSTFRIERLRQLFERDVARPFVVIGVSGNRHLAVPLLSNWYSRGDHIPNSALNVRVHRILPRSPHALHGFAKFLPGACLAQPVVTVDEPAWFRRGPAQCVSPISVAINDRAVARHGNLHVFLRLPFHPDRLLHSFPLRPPPLPSLLLRPARI